MINLTQGSANEVMAATPFVKLSTYSRDTKKKSVKFLLLFLIVTSGVFAIRHFTGGPSLFKDVSVIILPEPEAVLRDNSIIV
jgi:hypothetical protein